MDFPWLSRNLGELFANLPSLFATTSLESLADETGGMASYDMVMKRNYMVIYSYIWLFLLYYMVNIWLLYG